MKEYLEDLKAGGRPMTDKELAEHYKHLYNEVKKRNDNAIEYIKEKTKEFHFENDKLIDILRMLGETDE